MAIFILRDPDLWFVEPEKWELSRQTVVTLQRHPPCAMNQINSSYDVHTTHLEPLSKKYFLKCSAVHHGEVGETIFSKTHVNSSGIVGKKYSSCYY